MTLLLNNQHTTSFQTGTIPTVVTAYFRYVCIMLYVPGGQSLYHPVVAIQHAAVNNNIQTISNTISIGSE